MNFKLINFFLVASGALLAEPRSVCAQSAVFTYQGRLTDKGNPANGDYGMVFYLCNSATPGGGQIGNVGLPSVPVSNGLFTVSLGFDLAAFAATNLWLEIAVQNNGAPFTTLAPRQAITPSPYAITAYTAGNLAGSLPANQLTGALPSGLLAGIYSGAVNFDNSNNAFAGTFAGNGGSLTNFNASQLAVGTLSDSRLSTNVALLNGSNQANGTVAFAAPVAVVVTGADSHALSISNNAPAGAGTGIAVYGVTSQSSAAGVVGQNGNATGTGMVAIGNGLSGVAGLNTGAGLAAFGNLTAIYALATAGTSPSEAIYSINGSAVVGLNYFNGTQYKVFGNGAVSTLVSDSANQTRVMFAPEAPEVLFEDFGSGQLTNGRTHIALDPVFAANIFVDQAHPLRAFVQVEDACRGIFVTNKSILGFDVVELEGGTSLAHFSWHVIATRADEEQGVAARNAEGMEQVKRISHYSSLRFPVETNHPTAWRAVKARSVTSP